MKNPVLLLGGSGAVGSRVARTLRRLQPDLPIVIAARNAEKAAAVAAQIGGPTTAASVDLSREDLGLEASASFSAVVTLLKDPWLNL
ncbi:saccharopine dehydrogenase NADP-binding domain-containing protein [Nannocystis pusilla]|uniref:saccharopine dehydrogenase NADP-binding domain-containing protein n=1 Tax=Nannocystis pusilla TaxID=889268 RepID=UPI003B76E7C4